jgi:hypothetical protein
MNTLTKFSRQSVEIKLLHLRPSIVNIGEKSTLMEHSGRLTTNVVLLAHLVNEAVHVERTRARDLNKLVVSGDPDE